MPNTSILQAPQSNNGTMITPSAGSNRLVLYTYLYYSGSNPTTPSGITCNGVAGVFAFGDAPSSVPPRVSCSTWYFLESDIAAISGQTVTPAGASGTLDGRIVTVLQDCPQTSMIFDSDVGHASSGTISRALDRDGNSFSIMFSQSQNAGATLTLGEPSYVGRIAFSFSSVSYGYAADTFRTANATTVANSNTGMTVANFKSIGASIVDINGGSHVEVGSTVTVNTTGFTGTPTASFNVTGISATVTGSANVWSLDFSERVDGAVFPALPAASNLTLTNGSESAVLAMPNYIKKAAEVEIVYSMAVTSDLNYTSGAIAADGFTVEGAELIYTPYGDFVAFPDGSWTATSDGVVAAWFRPITGTGAGNVYYYEFTINGGSIVVTGGGLTSSGLTSSGLTRVGLTSAGL